MVIMMDKETLIKISKLYNMKPWQQEKHYVQSLVLVALSEYPMVLKGGTYLWFFHGLNRFSEDLDFTATGELPEGLEIKVSESLRMFGVENTVKIMTEDDRGFSFRLSAKGPLNTSEKDLCHVYVEISKREKVIYPTLPLKFNFDPYELPIKVVSGMALDEVAAEKIRAIMARDKARDIYDLVFLFESKSARFDIDCVNQKLKYYDLIFSAELFNKKLEEKKKNWKEELQGLVFGPLLDFDMVASNILKRMKKH